MTAFGKLDRLKWVEAVWKRIAMFHTIHECSIVSEVDDFWG